MNNKKTHDYLGFFFLIWLIVWIIPRKVTPKITPKAPIIYGMPISYIFIVVGQISLIRYPKIQDIAEMIMRIIPIIPIIKNPFFVSIFYTLSSIINILIIIRFSSLILNKMKKYPFFSFFHLISNKNYCFLEVFLIGFKK